LHGLVKLALVASPNVPFYVTVERWPPKAVEEGAACGIKALVAKAIVGVAHEGEAEGQHDIQLVSSVGLQPP